jgi:hypothetical protein
MLIMNPLVAIYYFLAGSSVAQAYPSMPTWMVPVLGILSLANFVFAIGIWNWKRWGMYGFAASAGVLFFINALYVNLFTALWGLVGIGLLAYLLRKAWSQME